MVSIPALSEKDLGDTLEGEFGIFISLKNPDGVIINTDINDKPLKGFMRRSYTDNRELRGNKADKTIINAPCVKLRISALAEIPASGEGWMVGIPESPIPNADIEWYNLDPKKAVEVNKAKGTIKLFLAKMQGSVV